MTAAAKNTGLIEIDENQINDVESELANLRTSLTTETSPIKRACKLAVAAKKSMALVRLMMPHIRAMAGLSIGFKTDRTDYTDEQLVVPVTDALCRGLPITGNCFNVIGGNFYCTLEGWEFLFGNQDVFTFPDLQIGSVEMGEEAKWVAYPPELHKKVGDRTITGRSVPGESYVEAIISCAHRGTGEVYELRFVDNRHLPGGMDERLKVPMNRGMHMQSVIGKAKCRAMKALWRHAHAKCRIVDPIGGDQDEDDRTIDATPQNVQTQPTTAPPAAKTAPKAAPKPTAPVVDDDPFSGKGDAYEPPEVGSFDEYRERMLTAQTWKEAQKIPPDYAHLKEQGFGDACRAIYDETKKRLWDDKKNAQ